MACLLMACAAASAQAPSRTRTVAFVLPSLDGQAKGMAQIRSLAGGLTPEFEREVVSRKLRWKQLTPALRVVWDPKVTLEAEGDPLGELAKAMDDDHTLRYDRLPESIRQGVLEMVAKAPTVGGATFGIPGAGLRVAVSTSQNIFLRKGSQTVSLEVSPPMAEGTMKRLAASMQYGPPPDDRELARWNSPKSTVYGAVPSFVLDLGTVKPEVYALVLDSVQGFLKDETGRNLKARRASEAALLRRLLGEDASSDLRDSHGGRSFSDLPADLQATLRDDVQGHYERYGFGSEGDAVGWLSGAKVDTQYVRVVFHFPSGGGQFPLFLGFEPYPSLLVP